MPRSPLLLLAGILLTTAACGAEEEQRAAQDRPVPVWQPDSPRVEAAGDTLQASARDSAQPAPVVPSAPLTQTTTDDDGDQPSPPPAEPPAGASETDRPVNDSPAASTAEEVLLRAERAYEAVRSLRADFIQDLTVPLLDDTQRSRGELFHRKPDRFLMRFSDPAGDIVVADGRYLWLYYPSTDPNQAIRTSMGQAGRLDLQREFLSNPTERFDATLEGAETVNGRAAHVLTLIPRSPSGYSRVRIWIDQDDALARRFEITEDNGNVRRVELHNLRVNTDLPDELFHFIPPEGVEIFDQ